MKAVLAASEKRKIRKRVKQAKRARARAGLHSGGKRPFGYELPDTGRTGKHDKPIREPRPHPTEAAVVVRMFEMAEATSQRKIARILNDEGIRSSHGADWKQGVVARVLGNPLYIGKIRRKVNGHGEVYDGQHEPIVDANLWGRVNKNRADPERRSGGRPMLTGRLLTRGKLRCGSAAAAVAAGWVWQCGSR